MATKKKGKSKKKAPAKPKAGMVDVVVASDEVVVKERPATLEEKVRAEPRTRGFWANLKRKYGLTRNEAKNILHKRGKHAG